MKYTILIFAILGLALAEVPYFCFCLRFVVRIVFVLKSKRLRLFFFQKLTHKQKNNSKRAPFVLADALILVETVVMVMTAIPSVSGSATNPFVIRYASPCASLPSAPPDVRNSDAPSVRLSATSPSVRFDARSSIVK